jgi:hypothetical protein
MESGLPPRRLFGDVRPLVPSESARQRLAEGRDALVVTGASVFLLVPADETASGRIVFGELHPDYLWGTQELQPTAIDICVVDSGSRSVLFCPAPVPEEVLGAIANSSAQAAFGSLGWARDGEEQVSVAWSQFLHAEFGAADWIVVASQPESYQMRYVAGFQQLFVPVVILALLVVMLLSIRQIRGTMGPLGGSRPALTRVAQAIRHQGRVQGDDEFGQLATAFNRMSQAGAPVLGAEGSRDRPTDPVSAGDRCHRPCGARSRGEHGARRFRQRDPAGPRKPFPCKDLLPFPADRRGHVDRATGDSEA